MFTMTEFKVVAILHEPKIPFTKKEQAANCSTRDQFYFCQLVLYSHILSILTLQTARVDMTNFAHLCV